MTTSRPRRMRRALVAAMACLSSVIPAVLVSSSAAAEPASSRHFGFERDLELTPAGTYETGIFDESAAEIVAYDARSKRMFVVNAAQATVEVLDVSRPSAPRKLFDLGTVGAGAADGSTVPEGAVANSVDVRSDGLVAVAVESDVKTDEGWVVFFDARGSSGDALGAVRVGTLPDMLTFTGNGKHILVANEGEPSEDFAVDPEGSVAVIDMPRGWWWSGHRLPGQDDVAIADFHAFEDGGSRELPDGVRVFGPTVNTDFPVSANLEPEYITTDRRGRTAYAVLQEANAVAVIDIRKAEVTDIWPLGTKDHSVEGNGLDPSDRDDAIDIRTAPVEGVYMPDGMASYTHRGRTYLVTANEGDAREWGDYVEPARVKDLGEDGLPPLCADVFDADVADDERLGRLDITTAEGLREDGSCYEELYSFGARSFSIWTTDGRQVFDSGDELEQVVAAELPEYFNSNHSESNFEGRSDNKGTEPEGVTVGRVLGRTYAFIGLERVGGIAVYDVTNPHRASFVTYVNNRDFSVSVEDDGEEFLSEAGDLGPEGLKFIPAWQSPMRGTPMLAAANEVSGTTTLFSVEMSLR